MQKFHQLVAQKQRQLHQALPSCYPMPYTQQTRTARSIWRSASCCTYTLSTVLAPAGDLAQPPRAHTARTVSNGTAVPLLLMMLEATARVAKPAHRHARRPSAPGQETNRAQHAYNQSQRPTACMQPTTSHQQVVPTFACSADASGGRSLVTTNMVQHHGIQPRQRVSLHRHGVAKNVATRLRVNNAHLLTTCTAVAACQNYLHPPAEQRTSQNRKWCCVPGL